MTSPTFTQVNFRLRNDDGNETGATWIDIEGADATLLTDINYRCRFRVDETANKAWNNYVWNLYFSKNAGAYTAAGSGQAITLSLSSYFTQGDDCTSQITGGSGTFLTDNNGMCESSGATNSGGAGNVFEVEFCFQIDSAYVANGDTIVLRVYNGTSSLAAYTDSPSITVSEAATLGTEESFHGHKSDTPALATQIPLTIEESFHSHTASDCNASEPSSYLVDIDLETGDLSEFTTTVTDGGNMSVSAGAALAGTNYGLQFLVNDTNSMYGQFDLVSASTTGIARARFYLDPNSTAFTTDYSSITVMTLQTSGGLRTTAVRLRKWPTEYRIDIIVYDNSGVANTVAATSLTDEPHYIELQLLRASTDIATDGEGKLWVDGSLQQTVSSIANYTRFSNLGKAFLTCADVAAGISGTFYSDQLVVTETSDTIGPYGGPSPVNLAIGESFHGHFVDEIAFTGITTLVVSESFHIQVSDNLSLSDLLVISESLHTHTAEDASLAIFIDDIILEWYALLIEECIHSLKSDEINLAGQIALSIEESFHANTPGEPTLTTQIPLVIEESLHSHLSDDVSITKSDTLAIEDSYHGHRGEDVAITKSDTLIAEESRHAQAAEDFILVQLHNLAIEEARHGNISDEIKLQPNLLVMEAVHTHTVDELALIKSDTLVVGDNLHNHAVDELKLQPNLAIEDSRHYHIVEAANVAPPNSLSVQDSYHEHLSDQITIQPNLIIEGGWHNHSAEIIQFATTLAIEDSRHVHTSQSCWFPTGVIFTAGHEDGTGNEWSSETDLNNLLNVTSGASLASSHYGIEISTETTEAIAIVTKVFDPRIDSNDLRIRFYLDPNSISNASSLGFMIGRIRKPSLQVIAVFYLGVNPLRFFGWVYYGESSYVKIDDINISDAPHWIECHLYRGGYHLWIDDNLERSQVISNEEWFSEIDNIAFGLPNAIQAGYSGTYYLDEFVVNDTGDYIGPADITIEDSYHDHTAEDFPIEFVYQLTILESFHGQAADEAVLTTQIPLAIEESFHSHLSDELNVGSISILTIAESFHSHITEDATLSTQVLLTIEDSSHSHVADRSQITKSDTLAIGESFHVQMVEDLLLTKTYMLEIGECFHIQLSEVAVLSSTFVLVLKNSFHAQISHQITIQANLLIQDSYHIHASSAARFISQLVYLTLATRTTGFILELRSTTMELSERELDLTLKSKKKEDA